MQRSASIATGRWSARAAWARKAWTRKAWTRKAWAREHRPAPLFHSVAAGAIAVRSRQLRRAIALDDRDIARHGAPDRILARARDHAVEERAVDRIVGERLEHRADARHRGRRQRDDVGIAAHEAHMGAIGDELHDVAR